MDRYNRKKGMRAIEHIRVLRARIERIEKANGIDKIRASIERLEQSMIGIVCPRCRHQHFVPLTNYRLGRYREICESCFKFEIDSRDLEALGKIRAAIPGAPAYDIRTDAPRHSVVAYLPHRRYDYWNEYDHCRGP